MVRGPVFIFYIWPVLLSLLLRAGRIEPLPADSGAERGAGGGGGHVRLRHILNMKGGPFLCPLLCYLLLGLFLAACGDGGSEAETFEPLVSFDTIPAAIHTSSDTIAITVELADTGERRAYGLMERPEIGEYHGMLFVYPETVEPTGSFWMYRTRIPLDIAFLDGGGVITAVLAMEPCTSPNPDLCRRYSPGVAYRAALEMRRGFFERHGVEPGDRVAPAPADVSAAP